MKIPKFGIGETLLGLSVAGLAAIGSILIMQGLEPAKLRWEAISVVNAPVADRKLIIDAETVRRDYSECTNGVQADMRQGTSVTRLPSPVRTLKAHGRAVYQVELPEDVAAGVYGVRLRETFNCRGKPEQIEAPWLSFEVVK